MRPLLIGLLLLAASCTPPVEAIPPKAAELKAPLTGPCKDAADLRASARALFAKGKLSRASRLLAEARRICESGVRETWDIEIAAAAALGDAAAAGVVRAEISAVQGPSEAAVRAAILAEKELDRRGRGDRAAAIKLFVEARELAARTNDRAALLAAVDKFVAAFEASPTDGEALGAAGMAALSLGDRARAQALFDRAVAAHGIPPGADEEHGFGTVGEVVVFRDGRYIAAQHEGDPYEGYMLTTTILDAATLRTRARFRGHNQPVYTMAVSPDGSMVATGSQDYTARLRDTRTGKFLGELAGHRLYVDNVDFSPDNKLVATAGMQELRIWDTATSAVVKKLSGTASAAFSPDGKLLAGGTRTGAALWDVADGSQVRALPGDRVMSKLAYSPDGTRVAGCSYAEVKLWDAATGAVVMSLMKPKRSVFNVRFSPDGAYLAAESDGDQLVWETRTGKLVAKVDGRYSAFSPDGKHFATGDTSGVHLREIEGGKEVRTFAGQRPHFLPSGRLVTDRDRSVFRAFDAATGTLLATGADAEADRVSATAFSPDSRYLTAGAADGTVRRWDLTTGALEPPLRGHSGAVSALAYMPDGKLLATGGADKAVRLVDPATGKLVKAFPAQPSAVVGLAISPDGKLLAASTKEGVRVYDIESAAQKLSMDVLAGIGSTITFSADGKLLAGGSGVKLWHWNLVNGGVVRPMEGHRWPIRQVAWSPDGSSIASLSEEGLVNLWDDATGKLRKTIDTRGARAVAFSADGKVLAIAGHSTALYDALTGERTGGYNGHYGTAATATFSPDGKLFATAGQQGSILLFRTDGARLGSFRAVSGEDAGYYFDGAGHVDFTGSRACAARDRLECNFGNVIAPFAVCEDHVRVRDLYGKVLRGEPLEEPMDADLPPLACADR